MTKTELSRIVKLLQSEYPHHDVPDMEMLLASWDMVLSRIPFAPALEAARAWLASGERFFPTSGQIYQILAEETAEDTGIAPRGPDAWNMIQERMRTTYPGHPASPWDAPECVRQALKAIGGMEIVRQSEEPQILRAQFLKTYEIYRQRAIKAMDVAQSVSDRMVIQTTAREPMLAPKAADNDR